MKILTFVFSFFWLSCVFTQENVTYKRTVIPVKKKRTVNPKTFPKDYHVQLNHLEAPVPDGISRKSYIMRQKIKSSAQFPIKTTLQQEKSSSSVPSPAIGTQFGLQRFLPNGVPVDLGVGSPTDNTLAVSNDGIVLLGVNYLIYAYNSNNETPIFGNHSISLNQMAGVSGDYFDPRIIYDPITNRFIIVFLNGSNITSNEIMVLFSTSDNPNDPWNIYSLPGNPLNNNRFTDFPTIAITENHLFITANLIIADSAWQVGFDRSIIWQIRKEEGYKGDTSLSTILYSDIEYDNQSLRNPYPVQFAEVPSDELYLLANKNFAINNDSIFLIRLGGMVSDNVMDIDVAACRSNLSYGMPPNGRQEDTDLSDPTSGLFTIDARIHGAVKIGDNIQFVNNTIDPSTGFSAIYHGIISSVSDQPTITASIIGDPVRDYAFPNIAWTGNEPCDRSTIIGFNHTSPTDYPGMSSIYYDNEGNYSDVITLAEGENYIDRNNTTTERWGDYFGIQRWYSKPGKVLSFGYYAKENRQNSGWCAELIAPDNNIMSINTAKDGQANLCLQTITITANGGISPYTYSWSNDPNNNSDRSTNLCLNDSVEVTVTDARGCSLNQMVYGETIDLEQEDLVYPNPFSDRVVVQFRIDQPAQIDATIYDLNGHMVHQLLQQSAKEGLNEISFSTLPLGAGEYILIIKSEDKEIVNKKIVKNG